MLPPPGYISLRDAVIHVATALAPDADVRGYLDQPPPKNKLVSPKWKWMMEPHDPYARQPPPDLLDEPSHAVDAPAGLIGDQQDPTQGAHPAWLALQAARTEIRSALITGMLACLADDGSEELAALPANWWRHDQGFQSMLTGSAPSDEKLRPLIISEGDLRSWIKRAGAGSARQVARLDPVAWMKGYEATLCGTAPKRDPTIALCVKETGATFQECRRAWTTMPPSFRGQRGIRKSGGKSDTK